MWLWIPNEQRLSFRWVFQHAIPILFPRHACLHVRMVTKDGDPQQRNELMTVIAKVFPNAIESGCGWHIGRSQSTQFVSLCVETNKLSPLASSWNGETCARAKCCFPALSTSLEGCHLKDKTMDI